VKLAPVIIVLASPAFAAEMLIERLDGPVTANEVRAFKTFMKELQLPPDNNHNAFAYGSAGGAAEALGDMCEVTGDREILDQLIRVAEHMLAARNDPTTGRIVWTGKRELVWPNKPEGNVEDRYSGTENGDVIAHIALAAQTILQNKSLWNEKIGGETYRACAERLVRECDRTIESYLLPYLVDPKTNRYLSPDSDAFGALGDRYQRARGKPIPWNQQFMLNGAFQRLAVCHELLGDDPKRVAHYDAIVKASCDWFAENLEPYTVDGHECMKWAYAVEHPLRHIEDGGHGGYDLLIYRAYRSGRYGVSNQTMQRLANTVAYVMCRADGEFAWRVDGKGNTRDYLPGTYLYLSEFVPALYEKLATANLKRAKTRPETAARILWVKWRRASGENGKGIGR